MFMGLYRLVMVYNSVVVAPITPGKGYSLRPVAAALYAIQPGRRLVWLHCTRYGLPGGRALPCRLCVVYLFNYAVVRSLRQDARNGDGVNAKYPQRDYTLLM